MGDLIFLHDSEEARANKHATDRILLRLAADQSAGQRVFGWMGAWPPPAKLLLVRDIKTDQYKLINPADYEKVGWTWERFAQEQNCELVWFTRNRASGITRPAKPREKWFRGAEYVVVR